MSNTKWLYIPLTVVLLLVTSVLAVHYSELGNRNRIAFREANLPFGYNGEVVSVMPEASNAGIQKGDKVESVDGVPLRDPGDWPNVVTGLKAGQDVTVVLLRGPGDPPARIETKVTSIAAARDLAFFAGFATSFLYTYAIPTLSILLAFWVAFLRPSDPLAWILLLVLLGMSSLSFENYPDGTLIGIYRSIFFSCWALGMLLFGIYFPERSKVDVRLPWLKWLLILPLLFQVTLTVASLLRPLLGFNPVDLIRPIARAYGAIGFYVNMLAIGLFFAILGHKSGTLESPDSRRRLKLLVWGTGIAITPTFLIVLYKWIFNVPGSFFQAVPFWIAIAALLLLNLFPLTLAYVIVVQQAMDVKVVLRQGIQYALARNGIKLLQGVILIFLILGFVWVLQNFQGSVAVQIGFLIAGLAALPLIDYAAKKLRIWIDRKFFREAYDAEQILVELSEDVRTMVETRPLLETVAGKISESLHVPQVALLLRKDGIFEPAFAVGYDTPPHAVLQENSKAVGTLKRDQHIVILNEYRDVSSTPTILPDEQRQIEELNTQVLLPVTSKDQLSGIISLSAKRSEEPFTPTDIRLLRSVATQTGLALENARLTEAIASDAAQKERLSRELEIAREVQERLFPQEFPKIKGLEYFGACRPALGVGGDYYDFLELSNGKLGFAIGDVSGKGIGAALMMASLQASLRGQIIHSGDDLASLLSHVNELIYETSTTNRYATFFYAQFEPESKKLTYVNAGHNPPFLLRTGESTPILLDQGGPVIGMLPPLLVQYEQAEVELISGDMIVGFTDGISEAMNTAEEEWGEDALLSVLNSLEIQDPKIVYETVVAAADKFVGDAKQHDDMTMIILSVL